MASIAVHEFITLDGVIETPSWAMDYPFDPKMGQAIGAIMGASEALLMGLRGLAVSSGSACTSASPEPSHVLRALGIDEELAHGSLRFGLGRFNTAQDVEYTIGEVIRVVNHLRTLSPLYELHRQSQTVPV